MRCTSFVMGIPVCGLCLALTIGTSAEAGDFPGRKSSFLEDDSADEMSVETDSSLCRHRTETGTMPAVPSRDMVTVYVLPDGRLQRTPNVYAERIEIERATAERLFPPAPTVRERLMNFQPRPSRRPQYSLPRRGPLPSTLRYR